jgi:asparagine synthase (glutamine-hydrolysing)
MSAITGIYHFTEEPINLQQCHNLMTALKKYPADSIQTWHSEKVFLGCHAQWITPESVGEQLPYHDSERQCTITADAIIDNREELFDKLHISKIDRSILTDSQLILLSYQKWGEEAPKHLIGDFAFMIWDQKKRKLFGARDFAGRFIITKIMRNLLFVQLLNLFLNYHI